MWGVSGGVESGAEALMPPRNRSARGMRNRERRRTLCQRGREPQLAPLFL
jgi:hypothetical protein